MFPEAKEIRQKRKQFGLTQSQLARQSGLSQSLLAKLESGKVDVSYSKVKEVFSVLSSLDQKESVKAADIMAKKIFSVSSNEKVRKAVQLMNRKNISQLPVIDSGICVGSISDRILSQKLSEDVLLKAIETRKVMGEAFPLISKETPLKVMADMLSYYSLLLVQEKGRLVGLITKSDLLKTI